MTNEQALAMLEWVGLMVPREEDIDSILWHVTERLEREGWWFRRGTCEGCEEWTAKPRDSSTSQNLYAPTKSAAVIAAFERQTGVRP